MVNLYMTPDFKKIPLTQGQFAIVDSGDYDSISQWKWLAQYNDCCGTFYAQRNGPGSTSKKKIKVQMHRLIVDAPVGSLVDHINGDTLDNRRANLRICTKAQNLQNTKPRKRNTSGYMGVGFRSLKWFASIRANGKHHWLGTFASMEEAVAARQKAEELLHGEFAASKRPVDCPRLSSF